MKILVTGGAGFIGSNVVDAYIEAGHQVVVMDNLFTGKWENLNPRARFHLMDVRAAEVRKVFERERFDLVNHHAAQMSVPASVEDPDFDADVNVRGFINLLEAARHTGVNKVIFISSGGAIYGEATEYPTTEQAPPRPLSPYAITKAVSEQYLAFYRHQHGLDYTVLRYANVYGPRQVPHGEAGVVSLFMDRILAGQPCTVYHYSDEPRGMTRDYCYVGDVVQANLQALTQGSGAAFNIGTGVATHTEDLFATIFRAIKAARPGVSDVLGTPGKGPARPGDLSRSCLVIDKARGELGFSPRFDLTTGIAETLQWHLARPAR
ncbi:MAG: NAD-dependent epimerase/dehydratase family protein [Thermodesulfobacteriota bacterium]